MRFNMKEGKQRNILLRQILVKSQMEDETKGNVIQLKREGIVLATVKKVKSPKKSGCF